MSNSQNKYLPVKAVARLLSVHPATVWRLVKEGRLPAPYKIGRNTTRWLLSEIEQALSLT